MNYDFKKVLDLIWHFCSSLELAGTESSLQSIICFFGQNANRFQMSAFYSDLLQRLWLSRRKINSRVPCTDFCRCSFGNMFVVVKLPNNHRIWMCLNGVRSVLLNGSLERFWHDNIARVEQITSIILMLEHFMNNFILFISAFEILLIKKKLNQAEVFTNCFLPILVKNELWGYTFLIIEYILI